MNNINSNLYDKIALLQNKIDYFYYLINIQIDRDREKELKIIIQMKDLNQLKKDQIKEQMKYIKKNYINGNNYSYIN